MSGAVAAAVALVVVDGRALVLRRPPDDRRFPDRWCLPGGQLDAGESPLDGVLREVLEETGLVLTVEESLGPRAVRTGATSFTIHRFVGRAPHARVVLSEEHTDFLWLSCADAAQADSQLPSGLAGEVTAELLQRFADGE